jgi:HK97 family phage portal protein
MSKDPVPAGILKNTGFDLTEEQVSDALVRWKSARQARSTAYLNSSFDYQTVGFDAKNMQLTESRQYVASEIARLCNVPNWVVSADAGDSMTYANVIDQRKDLIAFSFGFMNAIEDRLSMNDITANGQRVRFELDHFLRANAKERAEVLKILLESNIITLDEAREFEDLSPRGSGDPA